MNLFASNPSQYLPASIPLGMRLFPGMRSPQVGPKPPVAAGVPAGAITSQIVPQGIFSPQQTALSANRAIADSHKLAFGSPVPFGLTGISEQSPALKNRRMIGQAQALAQGRANAEQIRLSDRLANLQNLLGGQVSRAGDISGQLSAGLDVEQANELFNSRARGGLLDMLMNMGGGY